jgi:hypothetical protein
MSSAHLPPAARQTKTDEPGAEEREAGRLRSGGHRCDVDARRRLKREERSAAIRDTVRTENDGSRIVSHADCVNVGEIVVLAGRHLTAVTRPVRRSAVRWLVMLQTVIVEVEKAAARTRSGKLQLGYCRARVVYDTDEIVVAAVIWM